VPGGKKDARVAGEASRPRSDSCAAMSGGVSSEVELRSRTVKDSRIVWRCWGGIEARGSLGLKGVDFSGAGLEIGACRLPTLSRALLVEPGEIAVAGLRTLTPPTSTSRLFVLEERCAVGRGDVARVGEEGGLAAFVVPRVVSHERSAAAGPGLEARKGDCVVDGDRVDFFNGEPWTGVAARTVDGERAGDSGRRKGELRWLLKDNGAGRSGLDGLDFGGKHGLSWVSVSLTILTFAAVGMDCWQ